MDALQPTFVNCVFLDCLIGVILYDMNQVCDVIELELKCQCSAS